MASSFSDCKCYYENCSKTYKSKFNLIRHIEIVHQSLKRFKCDICGKLLSSKQNLYEHCFTHSGEKTFICAEAGCSKSYRQRSQLSNHKKIHEYLRVLQNDLKLREDIRKLSEDGADLHQVKNETIEKFNKVYKLPPITEPKFGIKLPNLNFLVK